ncbi:MAG TPA: hypothetical protein VF703_12225 [Pyrinomonadaceae bacterium]|jgi:hypothetical protein
MGIEIFHLTIKQVGDVTDGRFHVYAGDAESEAEEVIFTRDEELSGLMDKLHERKNLAYGFLNFFEQETGCAKIGAKLFKDFFVGHALQKYKDYRAKISDSAPRIAVHIPPTLYYLPWEVLRESEEPTGQFLSIEGSVIRYSSDSPQLDVRLHADRPDISKLLFMLASPEENPLIGNYEPEDMSSLQFFRVDPASYNNFRKMLADVQPFGLAFFGHGEIDAEGNSYLVFVEEVRSLKGRRLLRDLKAGYSFGNELKAARKMRVACILACESAWVGDKVTFQNSIAGSILLYTRIDFVIGAQTPIDFFAAQEFLINTLAGLAEHMPLDLALTQGRKAIRDIIPLGVRKESWRDWWVPVLYARTTDFELFPRPNPIPLPGTVVERATPSGSRFFSAVKSLLNRELFADSKAPTDILGG